MKSMTRAWVLIGAVAVVLLPGCRNKERVQNQLDPNSQMRLATIQDTQRAVVACRMTPLPETLPSSEATELGRAGSSVLLEVPKSKLEMLSALPGLERTSVWGESSVIAKMDGRLEQALLAAWDEGRQTPISLMARFGEGASNLQDELSKQGATPRTVAGPVVTLEADPETILRIVAMPGLMTLSLPQTLRPLDTNTP